MFAPYQPMRSWREQRPSNKGYFDLSVTGEAWRANLLLISFLYCSTQLCLGCVLKRTVVSIVRHCQRCFTLAIAVPCSSCLLDSHVAYCMYPES
jgi:hypothetical protein